MATLRFELRVEIGPQQRSNVPGLKRLARHAHQVLAQSVPAAPRVTLAEDADRGYATSALSTLL